MIGGLFCYSPPPVYQMSLFINGPEPLEGSIVLVVEEKDYDCVMVLSSLGSHTVMKRYLSSWKYSELELS